MRVIFACHTLATGKFGAQRTTITAANVMAERGHTVALAYARGRELPYTPRTDVQHLPYRLPDGFCTRRGATAWDVFVILYYNRATLISPLVLAHRLGIPAVLQECTNPDRLTRDNWSSETRWWALWEREMLTSAAARIRVTMPAYAKSFASYLRPQVRVFPNGAKVGASLASPGVSQQGRWTILSVNGFKKVKNVVALVYAFGRLAPEFPDWDLRVVGELPAWKAGHEREIQQAIEAHRLWRRIQIVAPAEDMEAEYAAAHIHVIASLSEACPTVVLEAMAAGLLSVGFEDCPGTNELIRHEHNGLLALADDRVGGLTNALRRLMADGGMRTRLGSRALEDAKAFDPKRVYDQWEQMLSEAAGYKHDGGRLFAEQYACEPERAMHARRMRHQLIEGEEAWI